MCLRNLFPFALVLLALAALFVGPAVAHPPQGRTQAVVVAAPAPFGYVVQRTTVVYGQFYGYGYGAPMMAGAGGCGGAGAGGYDAGTEGGVGGAGRAPLRRVLLFPARVATAPFRLFAGRRQGAGAGGCQ